MECLEFVSQADNQAGIGIKRFESQDSGEIPTHTSAMDLHPGSQLRLVLVTHTPSGPLASADLANKIDASMQGNYGGHAIG